MSHKNTSYKNWIDVILFFLGRKRKIIFSWDFAPDWLLLFSYFFSRSNSFVRFLLLWALYAKEVSKCEWMQIGMIFFSLSRVVISLLLAFNCSVLYEKNEHINPNEMGQASLYKAYKRICIVDHAQMVKLCGFLFGNLICPFQFII